MKVAGKQPPRDGGVRGGRNGRGRGSCLAEVGSRGRGRGTDTTDAGGRVRGQGRGNRGGRGGRGIGASMQMSRHDHQVSNAKHAERHTHTYTLTNISHMLIRMHETTQLTSIYLIPNTCQTPMNI